MLCYLAHKTLWLWFFTVYSILYQYTMTFPIPLDVICFNYTFLWINTANLNFSYSIFIYSPMFTSSNLLFQVVLEIHLGCSKYLEKAGLKFKKTRFMASGPIASWQIDGKTTETVTDLIFLCYKITVDSDCSHKIKRWFLFGWKAMTYLDSILESRDITWPTKICLVKAMFFPVIPGCEGWTIKKAECRKISAFELWCWRRLLGVPWIARRPNQSILKEISHGCSLEGLMLKLKLQYFGHLMWRTDYLEKTRMLGKIEEMTGWGCWAASPTQWTWI